MKYFVIGDQDTVLGFSLAGVEGITVSSAKEVEAAFNFAIKDREVGIIVITERCAKLIKGHIEDYSFTNEFPLIVEIPDREGKDKERKDFKQMVNSAIGIKI